MGRERKRRGIGWPKVRPELGSFPAGNGLILYRQIDEGAEIVRIVHGARQWEYLLLTRTSPPAVLSATSALRRRTGRSGESCLHPKAGSLAC